MAVESAWNLSSFFAAASTLFIKCFFVLVYAAIVGAWHKVYVSFHTHHMSGLVP